MLTVTGNHSRTISRRRRTCTNLPSTAGFQPLDPKRIAGPDLFGNTKHKGGLMAEFVIEDKLDPNDAKIENIVKALSAEAKLPAQQAADASTATDITAGQKLIKTGRCVECHKFHDQGDLGDGGPDLTGYGSREWLTGMISNPTHERFYGKEGNDRMPSFATDIDHPENNILRPENMLLLVDWLRGDWYEPAEQVVSGNAESGSKKPEAGGQRSEVGTGD